MLLRLARSVRPAATPPTGRQVAQLVLGSQESWGETNFAQLEAGTEDPIPDGADPAAGCRWRSPPRRATDPERRGRPRIVVFGDADFAGDGYLGSADNPTLLANT